MSLKRLIVQGGVGGARDSGNTALHVAAMAGKVDAIEFLVARGALVNPN